VAGSVDVRRFEPRAGAPVTLLAGRYRELEARALGS
jgi:hypothetical protein